MVLKIQLATEIDGQRVAIGCTTIRVEAERGGTFDYLQADDEDSGVFVTLENGSAIEELQALLLRPAARLTLRLNGQSDQGITIEPGGLVLCLGVSITSALLAAINATDGDCAVAGIAIGA